MEYANEKKFALLEESVGEKIEKVMFLATKMRGDSIIRNEFTDKEIRDIKRQNLESRK